MSSAVRGILRLGLAMIFLAGAVVSQDPARPRCTARLQGRFWPEQANQDPKLARDLSRTGDLEICTLGGWRYRWESVTVHISRLHKKHAKTPERVSASNSAANSGVN